MSARVTAPKKGSVPFLEWPKKSPRWCGAKASPRVPISTDSGIAVLECNP
jgi:hypothetical protein